MKMSKNETVVGIIIFTALVLLFLGLMWLQNYRIRGRGYYLVVHFEEVSGLTRGDPVTIAGLHIGMVQDMKLEGRKVSVSLRIEGKRSLPRGSIAVIKSQGVMGERYVDIIMGNSSESLESGETIPGLYQPGFNEVSALLGDVGDDIQAILSTARSLLDDTTARELRRSVSDIHSSTEQLRELLTGNVQRLDETMTNLHAFSNTLTKISPGQSPEELIPNLEKASRDLAETARHLQSFSAALDSMIQPALRGEGNLGKLLTDEALYRDLRALVGDLDSLAQDIRENPDRYVRIEIF
jgi:phospholipid/cholesterol/gamma-HCH transport system substrate-binding protein